MRILTLTLLPALALGAESLAVVYVDRNAPGPDRDGRTWDTAFLTIQKGANFAYPDGEVWVADGTYAEIIVLRRGVALYGGFLGAEPGGYETSRDQRDFVHNLTTIDAQQRGSCVRMAVGAVVDGFTLTDGIGTIQGNTRHGGAIFCHDTGEGGAIANNMIINNWAQRGGGIYADNSSPLIVDNVIAGNSCERGGGGIHCDGSSPTIRGNRIEQNVAGRDGGGLSFILSGGLIAYNRISGNTCGQWGGGIACYKSSPKIASNTISENSSPCSGGGISLYTSSAEVVGNLVTANRSAWGGGGISTTEGSSAVAIGNLIFANAAGGSGGGLAAGTDSLILANNVFVDNVSDESGGGVGCGGTVMTLANNLISRNSAQLMGGGVYSSHGSTVTIANVTLAGNTAAGGQALGCDSRQQEYPSQVRLVNCILWSGGDEVHNGDGSEITITYSDVWDGWPGEGNISLDPLFADPEGGDFHLLPWSPCIDAGDNAILDEVAGLLGIPIDELTDIDGEKRLVGSAVRSGPRLAVDMGADEFHPRRPPFG